MDLDTSMGQEYINKINESSEWPDIGECFIEKKPNEICKYKSVDDFLNSEDINCIESLIHNMSDVGKKLAMKIEENMEMFVQLEYLARGTDPRDVRDGHIQLMSQISRCRDALWTGSWSRDSLHFTETTPLYNLASVVSSFYKNPKRDSEAYTPFEIVISNQTMRPLGKFFMQLCHDVGMINVHLVYADPSVIECLKRKTWLYTEPSDNIGCTGVIAERADLDSAIDTFISSSVTAPWRLKQIYVQESVFEDFKKTLTGKSGAVASGNVVVGDKKFLIDKTGIPTHVYRTTKELLSLIETPYLSLWAAETALFHEIALRSSARTVWVNEYATFYGPPRSALSVFTIADYLECDIPTYKKLTESLKPWAQLQTAERFEVIVTAIKESKDEEIRKNLHDFALNWRSEDVLYVTEKTVCFGIQNQMNVVAVNGFEEQLMIKALKALINGNAVANYISKNEVLFKELQELGVPIQQMDGGKDNHCKISIPFPLILEQLKVIRTNYGTILAN